MLLSMSIASGDQPDVSGVLPSALCFLIPVPFVLPPPAPVSDAQFLLSQLSEFSRELGLVRSATVASIKETLAEIMARKYESSRSSYVYDDKARLVVEENAMDDGVAGAYWDRMEMLSLLVYNIKISILNAALEHTAAARKTLLEDALAREELKEKLFLDFAFSAQVRVCEGFCCKCVLGTIDILISRPSLALLRTRLPLYVWTRVTMRILLGQTSRTWKQLVCGLRWCFVLFVFVEE